MDWIWQWTLRLLLPVIIGLYVMLVFWLVFDGMGSGAWSFVSGVLLGLIAVCVAVWAWSAWLPPSPTPSKLVRPGYDTE